MGGTWHDRQAIPKLLCPLIILPKSEHMDSDQLERLWYRAICSDHEIDRILAVADGRDHLLKLRADALVDHVRLLRVYRARARRAGSDWSFEGSFDTRHFERFLESLPPDARNECNGVTYGNFFSNDPGGQIQPTEYGPIVTISESIQYFLKFMHLALMDYSTKVPMHVRWSALRIALRVMLQTEALDFDLDPRGIISEEIAEAISRPMAGQLQFIAGHEFAHHILGHLSEDDVSDRPSFIPVLGSDEPVGVRPVYNRSQLEELEADVQAILLPKYAPAEQSMVFQCALMWFNSLDIYEGVLDAVKPKGPWDIETHPCAEERYEHLMTAIPTPKEMDLGDWDVLRATTAEFKKRLVEDVALNIEYYEVYGSIYLDEPNTYWRGAKLIDRVDY